MFDPVSVVMTEMVALILQGVERLVLNFPARPRPTHDLFHCACGERQVGYPGPPGDFASGVRLFVEQKVDVDLRGTCTQAQALRPSVRVAYSGRVSGVQLLDWAARQASGKLLEKAFVRIRLDVQKVMPAVAGDLPQMRRIGV